jgi:excisionase family DNA binding protein
MSDGLALPIPHEFLDVVVDKVVSRLIADGLVHAPTRSPYLTASEAAEVLRCDRRRIYRMVSDGRIAGVKDGSRVLVDRASIEAYLRRE